MKSIVFLDLDGVVNCQLFCHTHEFQTKKQEVSDNRVDQLRNATWSESLGVLRDFVLETDTEIVISSTWRQHMILEEFKEFFDDYGIGDRIIGTTPILRSKGVFRGNEVWVWLEENRPSNFRRYVIFDDDSDFLYWQKDNLFLVDNYCGLTHNVAYRAKRFLDSLK